MVHWKWTVFKACTFWLWWYYDYLKKKSVLSITYQTTDKCPKLVFKCMQLFSLTFACLFFYFLCVLKCAYLHMCVKLSCGGRIPALSIFSQELSPLIFLTRCFIRSSASQLSRADWPASPHLPSTEVPSSCPHSWVTEPGIELRSSYLLSKQCPNGLGNFY